MHIGITIGLHTTNDSLWNNGILQNALALARTFKKLYANVGASADGNNINNQNHHVHRVTLVNTTAVAITHALPWNLLEMETLQFDAVKHSLDVLIFLGGQLPHESSAALRQRGVKLVGYKCGSEAVVSTERIVHGLPVNVGPHYNQHYHALWLVPQVAERNVDFYQTLHRCSPAQTHIVPFVWDPKPIEQACQTLPNKGLYTPNKAQRARRFICMEPNRELLKTFMTPLLIMENFYRQDKDAVQLFSINNIFHRREHIELLGVLAGTDIFNDKKLTVEGRLETATLLANYADIVVSHQSGNPLNYAYLEACWLGYPLVHNGDMCADLGFYYAGFDVANGVAAVRKACEVGQRKTGSFDSNQTPESATAYRERQRAMVKRHLATEVVNVAAYGALLADLLMV